MSSAVNLVEVLDTGPMGTKVWFRLLNGFPSLDALWLSAHQFPPAMVTGIGQRAFVELRTVERGVDYPLWFVTQTAEQVIQEALLNALANDYKEILHWTTEQLVADLIDCDNSFGDLYLPEEGYSNALLTATVSKLQQEMKITLQQG